MYNILTLNKISSTGIKNFSTDYKIADDIKNPDAILVRSASMHEMELAPETLAIARAGAGVNNIPECHLCFEFFSCFFRPARRSYEKRRKRWSITE